MTDYDIEKALREYRDDVAWENEMKAKYPDGYKKLQWNSIFFSIICVISKLNYH